MVSFSKIIIGSLMFAAALPGIFGGQTGDNNRKRATVKGEANKGRSVSLSMILHFL